MELEGPPLCLVLWLPSHCPAWVGSHLRRAMALPPVSRVAEACQQVFSLDWRLRKSPCFLELPPPPLLEYFQWAQQTPSGMHLGFCQEPFKCSPRKGQTCSSGSALARYHSYMLRRNKTPR